MAGILFNVNSGEIALSTTPLTVLQIKAPSNQRVLLRRLAFTGKMAAGGTDTPVKVRFTRSTSNFGTAGSSVTPAKQNTSDSETVQTTAGKNFSVEPTTPADALMWWEVQPQSGIIENFPPNAPVVIPGGSSLNIEATAGAGTPTVNFQVTCEE